MAYAAPILPSGRPGSSGSARTWIVVAIAVLTAAALAVTLFVVVDDGGEEEPAAPEAPSEPEPGGVLRLAVTGVQSLDPAAARDAAELMMADHIFDTLVVFDPESQELRPGLAESWEADPGLQRFVFRLREGVQFHDGRPVTATDVKATLERIARPGSDSEFRFLLEPISGYFAFHAEQSAPGLAGVEVVNPRTLAVTLDRPYSEFPLVLSNPGYGIVPAERGPARRFRFAPIGSGPLQVAVDGAGGEGGDDAVRLERNPNYEPRPTRIDAVEIHLVDDAEDGFAMLNDDTVDMAPVPPDGVADAAERYGDAGLSPFLAVTMFGFNLEHEKFQDHRFRRAIVAAANRDAIVSVAYGASVLVAEGIVPAGVPGSTDACGDRCDHDLELARRLLDQAFPDGNVPTVMIDFDDDERQRRVAASLRATLREAGIPARLRPHAFKDYGGFISSGRKELFRLGWIANFPSADDFLGQLFLSGQPNNLVRFSNPEVDGLIQAARAEGDPSRRRDLYSRAEQLILDHYPVVPLAQFTNRWAAAEHVAGLEMTPLGTFDITEVSLTVPGLEEVSD